MRTDELESLLAVTSVDEVVAAIDDPARQTLQGWDLHGWTYFPAPTSVCFLHFDDRGDPVELLVAVRASRSRRERLAGLIADFPLSAKLVLIE